MNKGRKKALRRMSAALWAPRELRNTRSTVNFFAVSDAINFNHGLPRFYCVENAPISDANTPVVSLSFQFFRTGWTGNILKERNLVENNIADISGKTVQILAGRTCQKDAVGQWSRG